MKIVIYVCKKMKVKSLIWSLLYTFTLCIMNVTAQEAPNSEAPIDTLSFIDKARLYIVFDSIRTKDFLPYFTLNKLTYTPQTKRKKNRFEEKYDQLTFLDKIKRKSVYKLSIERPEIIEYYGLKPYEEEVIADIDVDDVSLYITGIESEKTKPTFGKLSQMMKKKEYSPWTFKGNLAIQLSQYYVTKNWYKGGSANATFLTIFDYNISYKKRRILWDNDFDLKIGIYNTTEDSIRAFRVNNDVFKISSLFGYQIKSGSKWYYSAGFDFNTSMFTGYKGTNSNEVVTAFLSPTRLFFSLGIDYRHSNKTNIRIAPVAYKVIFLPDKRIDPLSVGIDSTKSCAHYPGYMLQASLNWKFTSQIVVNSDFEFFSTYNCKNIELDWEIVGKFIINRYLSTRLSLIMRFDNTPKDEDAKIQIQEQLSFGFSYIFR